MRKAIVLPVLALLAVAYPAAASAGAFKGVVVAKDKGRHALVLASQTGTVHTIRTQRMGIRVGARLAVRARARSDGTFRATRLARHGQADHARVRAVVVRRLHRRLLVSAGHSVLSIRLRNAHSTRGLPSGSEPRRGDIVDVSVTISKRGELEEDEINEIGHVDKIELEGTVVSVTPSTASQPGSLTIRVGGLSFDVVVSPGFDVSGLKPGDRVEVEATVSGSTLTLAEVDQEDQGDDVGGDDGGGGGDD